MVAVVVVVVVVVVVGGREGCLDGRVDDESDGGLGRDDSELDISDLIYLAPFLLF